MQLRIPYRHKIANTKITVDPKNASFFHQSFRYYVVKNQRSIIAHRAQIGLKRPRVSTSAARAILWDNGNEDVCAAARNYSRGKNHPGLRTTCARQSCVILVRADAKTRARGMRGARARTRIHQCRAAAQQQLSARSIFNYPRSRAYRPRNLLLEDIIGSLGDSARDALF